ncbi:hypothetical protein AHAS_Ahas18G0270500 [Arachis hypogaea]
MELQLGLDLPTTHHDHHNHHDSIECCELWSRGIGFSSSESNKKHVRKKRSFEDYAFGQCSLNKTTLPLLVWSGHPNEEEEEDDSNNGNIHRRNIHLSNKNEGEENHLVNMEGVTVGRKIDLMLYNSYQTLTHTLITMFAKYQDFEEDGTSYKLTFQNEQGDWLLAGHVPWQSFIGTVRRLAILRNEK